MTDLNNAKLLRELAEMAIPKIPGICNECSFELSYRHRYGCSIPEDAFAEAANPQAIIEVLDMVDRYREALVRARCEMLIVLENHSKVEMLSPLAIDEALDGGK